MSKSQVKELFLYSHVLISVFQANQKYPHRKSMSNLFSPELKPVNTCGV